MYFHLFLKIGHFFQIPQFLRKIFFWLFSKLNIKMSYPYRNFATKISFIKGFLKSFIIHPLIAFTKGHTVLLLIYLIFIILKIQYLNLFPMQLQNCTRLNAHKNAIIYNKNSAIISVWYSSQNNDLFYKLKILDKFPLASMWTLPSILNGCYFIIKKYF